MDVALEQSDLIPHSLFSLVTWWKGCDRSEGNQSSWHNGSSSAAPL